nr:hypothetical protein [Maliibacterium massiliense]
MNCFYVNDLPRNVLPGRAIANAVGRDARVSSEKMTVGYARYSAEAGPMEPHNHAEETLYIIDAQDGYIDFGGTPEHLEHTMKLHAGMILHFPALEWHAFRYDEGGFVDALFIYGQVDNIRPEGTGK